MRTSVPDAYDDGVFRPCWCCNMRNTRTNLRIDSAAVDLLGKPVQPGDLTTYRCPVCKATAQWVWRPRMDGTYAEKHKVGSGYSCSSMQSDPDCNCYPVKVEPDYGNIPDGWIDMKNLPACRVGIPDGNGGFTTTYGPCDTIDEILDEVDGDPGEVLLGIGFAGDIPLYRWHDRRGQWIELPR